MSGGSLLLLLLSLTSCLPPSTWPLRRGHKPPNRGLWPLHARLYSFHLDTLLSALSPRLQVGSTPPCVHIQFLSLHQSLFPGFPATLEPNPAPHVHFLSLICCLFACSSKAFSQWRKTPGLFQALGNSALSKVKRCP